MTNFFCRTGTPNHRITCRFGCAGRGRSSGLAAFVVLAVVLGIVTPARSQVIVQQVAVEVAFEGVLPHQIVRDRLVATVASVAERLLLGRPVEQVATLVPSPGETIASVVERVTVGYAIAEATVAPGAVTTVAVRMRAVAPLVREVTVIPDLRAMHPRVRALIVGRLQPAHAADLQALLIGLPVEALQWAAALIEARARTVVEATLPGFTATVRIRPSEVAQIELAVSARDSRVIRNIGVRFRSTSIPVVLLDQHGPQVASMAEPLRGLPVAFAEANTTALEELLNDALSAYPPTAEYGIVATTRLAVAETTYVTVTAESLVYRARVEASLNFGTNAPGPKVVAHLGQLVSPSLEPFVEIRVVPTPLSMTLDLGLRLEVTPDASIGATYASLTQQATLWTTVQVSHDIGLRGEWTAPSCSSASCKRAFEGAATSRLNDFLTWELVGTSTGDFWLRLISNL